MKHYVVVNLWKSDYLNKNKSEYVNICGITHSLEGAKKIFAKELIKEIEFAKENNWVIDTNADTYFVSYLHCEYDDNHSILCIAEE